MDGFRNRNLNDFECRKFVYTGIIMDHPRCFVGPARWICLAILGFEFSRAHLLIGFTSGWRVGTQRHGQVEVQSENFSPFMDEIWVAKLSENRHGVP